MTVVLLTILLFGIVLIATEYFSKINKSAVAIFVGVLCWILFLVYGKTFVADQFSVEYSLFVATTGIDSVNEFIEQQLFLKSILHSCEIVFYLLATMGIVEVLNSNGCFDFIKRLLKTHNSKKLLWFFAVITFLISANLDNLSTTTLMLVVMNSLITNSRQKLLYGAIIVFAANCGGVFTVIGEPNNLILWTQGFVTPTNYSAALVLPAIVSLVIPTALVARYLPEHVDFVDNSSSYRGDDGLLKSWQRFLMLFVGLGGLWFVPTFHRLTNLSPFVGAFCVLSLLWIVNELTNKKLYNTDRMIIRRVPVALQYSNIQLILFFIGISLAIDAVQLTGVFDNLAFWCSENIHNIYILAVVSGIISSVLDSMVVILANASIFSEASTVMNSSGFSQYFSPDGLYWPLVSYCSAMGGSLLIIGTTAGCVFSRVLNVSFSWYFRFMTGKILLGWLAGLIVFFLVNLL